MTRSALVTGGSRGIGRAVIERLTAAGWSCVNLDLLEPVRTAPGEHFEQVDLSDRDAVDRVLRSVVSRHTITGLVNNAGMGGNVSVDGLTADQFAGLAQVNVWCPIQCLQAVLPAMRQAGWGRVVNVSSRAALGKSGRSLYAATKAGLHGLTRTWALELAAAGITVNTVSPGPIATDMFHRLNPPESARTAEILAAVPVGRVGSPDEVAWAITSFMEAAAGFTTGQLLHVCGGLTVGAAG